MYPYNTTDKILLHILLIAVMVLFFFIIFVKKNLSTFYNCKKKRYLLTVYFGTIKLLFVHPERKPQINSCTDILTEDA